MNSPFKMKPGRGNMPKTGRGVPPTLMSCSPMKQEVSDIELTERFDAQKKKYAEARNAPGKIEDLAKTQGIKVDAATGGATSIAYGQKYIPGSMGVRSKIVSEAGELVKEAKVGEDDKLKAEYEKMKTFTEKRRGSNAEKYNIGSGFTSTNNASKKQKEFLLNTGKAKSVK
jgi:hypothetical protein